MDIQNIRSREWRVIVRIGLGLGRISGLTGTGYQSRELIGRMGLVLVGYTEYSIPRLEIDSKVRIRVGLDIRNDRISIQRSDEKDGISFCWISRIFDPESGE